MTAVGAFTVMLNERRSEAPLPSCTRITMLVSQSPAPVCTVFVGAGSQLSLKAVVAASAAALAAAALA